jgi:hypothetical protein
MRTFADRVQEFLPPLLSGSAEHVISVRALAFGIRRQGGLSKTLLMITKAS